MGDPREEISNKEHRVSTAFEEEALSLPIEERAPIGEHMNNYMKLIAYLVHIDIEFEEEDKEVILLNSLPDEEYETFILTLINGKQTINYSDVSAALENYEVRKKNKYSSSKNDSVEELTVRGRSSSKKGKDDRGRSKFRPVFRDLKNQSAYCKELEH